MALAFAPDKAETCVNNLRGVFSVNPLALNRLTSAPTSLLHPSAHPTQEGLDNLNKLIYEKDEEIVKQRQQLVKQEQELNRVPELELTIEELKGETASCTPACCCPPPFLYHRPSRWLEILQNEAGRQLLLCSSS